MYIFPKTTYTGLDLQYDYINVGNNGEFVFYNESWRKTRYKCCSKLF